MTLHWHMTGERHFKFLTGRDISPKPSHQADSTRALRSAASHSEPRCNLDESRGSWRGRVGPVIPVNGRAAPLKREVYSCFICSFIFTFTLRLRLKSRLLPVRCHIVQRLSTASVTHSYSVSLPTNPPRLSLCPRASFDWAVKFGRKAQQESYKKSTQRLTQERLSIILWVCVEIVVVVVE